MVFHLALKAVKEWYFVTKHMLRCYSWVRHCSEVISEGLDSHGRSTSGRRAGRCCASQRWWCGKAGSYLMESSSTEFKRIPVFGSSKMMIVVSNPISGWCIPYLIKSWGVTALDLLHPESTLGTSAAYRSASRLKNAEHDRHDLGRHMIEDSKHGFLVGGFKHGFYPLVI